MRTRHPLVWIVRRSLWVTESLLPASAHGAERLPLILVPSAAPSATRSGKRLVQPARWVASVFGGPTVHSVDHRARLGESQ
jgi:hypothetical protein